ncbi:MAG: asparaginase [Spirochaetales bacterium]|nr:asparaginase [Spirochaetales bacterium]
MGLHIIATGGTFDKHYDPIGGTLGFEKSHLPEILQTARLVEETSFEIVSLVDSLDMGEQERLAVLQACQKCSEQRIVVIHGTDTMQETARIIGQAQLDKCIILTGAMVPYSVRDSDALFNLGAAVTASTLLEQGTWVVMNGRALPWHSVRKDKERGIFISQNNRV